VGHLGQGRNAHALHLLGFERPRSPQLPNAGESPVELVEDEHRPLDQDGGAWIKTQDRRGVREQVRDGADEGDRL
jgi:hypothetical protein